jgi:hypothetical protein
LYNEKLSLSREIVTIVSSLENSAGSHGWLFTEGKHINDVFSTDDELLHTLDNISNIMLGSNEDDKLSTEMDSLSAQ